MKFRKKPIVIEAIQWNSRNNSDVDNFTNGQAQFNYLGGICWCTIETKEGKMTADVGDWIIKGIKNEFYPCKPEIFNLTYEPYIEPPSAQEYFKAVLEETSD